MAACRPDLLLVWALRCWGQVVAAVLKMAAEAAALLIGAFDGSLRLGLLPTHLWPSGHVFFIQRQAARHRVAPLAVHLTFQNCDQSGKRHRIREALLWDTDPAEHYAPPGGRGARRQKRGGHAPHHMHTRGSRVRRAVPPRPRQLLA